MFNIIYSLSFIIAFGLIIFILLQQVKQKQAINHLQNDIVKLSIRVGTSYQKIQELSLRSAHLQPKGNTPNGKVSTQKYNEDSGSISSGSVTGNLPLAATMSTPCSSSSSSDSSSSTSSSCD